MANKNEISTVLHRNLKEGKEYTKLIPRVKCERTSLGEGDTFFTVDQMKAWIETYAFQTAKLAPVLKGQSLEGTVNNVYRFLYNHVQYQADGALQQLRSPACTWAQRKEGVDCKSFSVFASAILLNLGIKHFIRQIRQPYFYPEEFTHVYVVVPKDQSVKNYSENAPTFVLDATKHENVESDFIEKVDLHMTKLQHIGLNAPQDERSRKIIENFNRFSEFLIEKGASLRTVNAMRAEISKYTSQGEDPEFSIAKEGIVVEGKLFPINLTVHYENGLGVVATGTVATATAIAKMLPEDFFKNTFGAIFANGFDPSCWGASYSESEAGAALEVDIPFLVNKYSGISETLTNQSLDKFLNGIGGYIDDAKNGQKPSMAECTRKGYKLRQEGAEDARQNILNQIESSGMKLVPTGRKDGYIKTDKMPSFEGKTYEWGHSKHPYQYESYRLEEGSNPNPGSGSSGDQSDGDNTSNVNDDNKSGSNTGLIVGGVAMAALPLFFMMKKKK